MSINSICWNCQNTIPKYVLLCKKCNKIQPPQQIDEFKLMGVCEKFDLDIDIETENSMKQYLINQAKIKKQKHTYSLEEFGLSEKNINDHLKNYIMNNEF